MSEFFGVENVRMPSIYYGIIATHPGTGLCKAARKKWGFIASHDGLALAYPVVAARKDGSAIVFFSYSGAKQLPHSLGPAYPGGSSHDCCCQVMRRQCKLACAASKFRLAVTCTCINSAGKASKSRGCCMVCAVVMRQHKKNTSIIT